MWICTQISDWMRSDTLHVIAATQEKKQNQDKNGAINKDICTIWYNKMLLMTKINAGCCFIDLKSQELSKILKTPVCVSIFLKNVFLISWDVFIQGRFTQSYLSLKGWCILIDFYSHCKWKCTKLSPVDLRNDPFLYMIIQLVQFLIDRGEAQTDTYSDRINHLNVVIQTKHGKKTFRLQLTFQTIPHRPTQSGLSTSWQMTSDLRATSDLWSKPSPVTSRSSAPLGAAHRMNEGMWGLQILSTVWASCNLSSHFCFLEK